MNNAMMMLQIEANKKSGGIAALLNLILPGAGYMYCGNWITGVVAMVFCVAVAVVTMGIGYIPLALILVVDGLLCAKRYNKKLFNKALDEMAATEGTAK